MSFRALNHRMWGLKSFVLAGVVAAGALLGLSQQANAGFAPDVFMSVEIRDTAHTPLFNSGEVNLASIGSGNMTFGYAYVDPVGNFPALQDSRYGTPGSFGVIALPESGTNPARLHVNMTFENQTANTLEFILNYRMPLTATYNNPMPWTANMPLILTGNDMTLSTIPGMSMFVPSIDATAVGSQYDHPTAFFNGGGTSSHSTTPLAGVAADATQDAQIRLAFSITPGDRVNFNGNITLSVVPAPGAAALLGLAGLVTTRRRRR